MGRTGLDWAHDGYYQPSRLPEVIISLVYRSSSNCSGEQTIQAYLKRSAESCRVTCGRQNFTLALALACADPSHRMSQHQAWQRGLSSASANRHLTNGAAWVA